MKLTRTQATLLGVLTVWPGVFFLMFTALTLSAMLGGQSGLWQGLFSNFQLLMILQMGTSLLGMALLAFYLVHVFQNRALGDKRLLWAVVLFLGSLIAMPVYWFMYIRRQPGPPLGAPATGTF